MAILQPLIDFAAVSYLHGVRHVVLSPGSRSAALTLSFSRHGGFQIHPVIDERSAGFIALGMAQQLGKPVVLICTSGSAGYNFAPAVSEAFFQQIPLVILTADRPREWTHQFDGQTIYQSELYGKHVKKFFELPSDYSHPDSIWAINRTANEAVNLASQAPYGPVHINVPVREPFYPTEGEVLAPSPSIRLIQQTPIDRRLHQSQWNELLDEWEDSGRILIAGGQHVHSILLNESLSQLTNDLQVPVLADSIANLSGNESCISHHDLILSGENNPDLAPDLLITYGLSFVSKELKTFLRRNPAIKHWHIGHDGVWADPLQSVTRQIAVGPDYFFSQLFEKIDYQLFTENAEPENDAGFLDKWLKKEYEVRRRSQEFLNNLTTLVDLSAINAVLSQLMEGEQLHIGNSMPIRYVNALGMPDSVKAFCNRGTSGIDGSLSTAIGAALTNTCPTTLIIGDVSFLYDRNGLLANSLPQNLKIVVVNNGGGNIFRMIDGPARQPELEEYFETRHPHTARRTAEDAGITYFSVNRIEDLATELEDFRRCQQICLLEIFTNPEENRNVWKQFKQLLI